MGLIVVSIGCVCSESCLQWDQYLGNPGRTAYTGCNGPDSPEILWEITLDGVADTPFIIGDKLIIVSEYYGGFPLPLEPPPDTNITVIDLLTGTLLQKIVPDVEPEIAYPVGDTILISAGPGLYELDLSSEEMSLVSKIPEKCSLYRVFQDCYPLVFQDKMVLPSKSVVCLSRSDYSTLWNLETSLDSLHCENAEVLNIAASMDQVYIVLKEEKGKKVLAVNSETGEPIWMNDLEVSNIAADGSVIYAAGDNLNALDAHTGELLWTFESDYAMSNIAVGPTAVYITDYQNYLYAVGKETGKIKWKSHWEEADWITYIIVAGDTVICSNILNMTAFSAEDGAELWNMHFRDFSGPSPKKPCPAIAEGILVVPRKGCQMKGDSFVIERPEVLLALASDPELFEQQGDVFLSKGVPESAINSYEKAAQLYEREGNQTQSQEMQNRIDELKNQLETTTPQKTPECILPARPKLSSTVLTFILLILAGIFGGILIACYLIRKKKP